MLAVGVFLEYFVEELQSAKDVFNWVLSWLLDLTFCDVRADGLGPKGVMACHLSENLFCFFSDPGVVVTKTIEKLVVDSNLRASRIHVSVCRLKSCLEHLDTPLYNLSDFVAHRLTSHSYCRLERCLVIAVDLDSLFAFFKSFISDCPRFWKHLLNHAFTKNRDELVCIFHVFRGDLLSFALLGFIALVFFAKSRLLVVIFI